MFPLGHWFPELLAQFVTQVFLIELPNKHILHSTTLFAVFSKLHRMTWCSAVQNLPFVIYLLCSHLSFKSFIFSFRGKSLNRGMSDLEKERLFKFPQPSASPYHQHFHYDVTKTRHWLMNVRCVDDFITSDALEHLTNRSSCFPPSPLRPWWAPSMCR